LIITLIVLILFFAFGIALALFWWLLTEVLPWLIVIYLLWLIFCWALARHANRRDAA
jgi:hypothetical protein